MGSIVINRTAKVLLHRVRPHLWESPAPEFDYGFPRGHAMSSMTLVVVLVILAWGSRWRWWVLAVGTIFVLVIGWTRLYLGVHYQARHFGRLDGFDCLGSRGELGHRTLAAENLD